MIWIFHRCQNCDRILLETAGDGGILIRKKCRHCKHTNVFSTERPERPGLIPAEGATGPPCQPQTQD